MRKSLVTQLVVLIAASVGVSVAGASKPAAPAWTDSKAARIVEREARFALPQLERVALEGELLQSLGVFRALEMWALEVGDEDAWWTYHGYSDRYHAVRDGLRVADPDCGGSGRAVGVGVVRFRRFDCLATSVVLTIPSTELDVSSGGKLPRVVEGESRELGPYLTQLRMQVTERGKFAYE